MAGTPDYLSKTNLYDRFEAYKKSEDFKADLAGAMMVEFQISEAFDEPAPPESVIAASILSKKLKWLSLLEGCEQNGHDMHLEENNNGASYYVCSR